MKALQMLAPAAVGLTLVLGACGGSTGTGTTATTAAAGQEGAGSGSPFNDPAVQQCLADKGITLPARGDGAGAGGTPGAPPTGGEAPPEGQPGQPGRPGFDDATRQAMQDCGASFGPGGGAAGGGFGRNDPAIQQCLADKGVTLPARGQQNGEAASRPGSAGGGAPPSMDESLRQAVEACRAEVGAASSSPTTAATPSDTPTTPSG